MSYIVKYANKTELTEFVRKDDLCALDLDRFEIKDDVLSVIDPIVAGMNDGINVRVMVLTNIRDRRANDLWRYREFMLDMTMEEFNALPEHESAGG
jgi:hypothetical protein